MVTVDLPDGTIHYRQSGSGAPIVFLHGYLMGANLGIPSSSCSTASSAASPPNCPSAPTRPRWPLAADLTTAGLGRLVAEFLEALDLHQVILVGDDAGGAIAQEQGWSIFSSDVCRLFVLQPPPQAPCSTA